MVNVDPRSPHRYASLNSILDEMNGWVIEMAIDVDQGRLRAIFQVSCRRRPGDFDEEREIFSEVALLSPEKMMVLCMEDLSGQQAIEALATEIELHGLGDLGAVKAAITDRFSRCFLEPAP
jgi:hypothetical protein